MKRMEGLVEYILGAIKEYFQAQNGNETAASEFKSKESGIDRANGDGFKHRNSRNGNGIMPHHNQKFNQEGRNKTIDLMEYWRILLKRKWVAISVCTLIVFLVGILTFTATPLYRAQATVLIEEQPSNMLSIQEAFSSVNYHRYDYMNYFFNTQLKLIRSRFLAERVAKSMNLRTRPEMQTARKSKKGLIQGAKNLISLKWIRSEKKSKQKKPEPWIHQDPNSMYASFVLGGLNVTPVKDTRLVHLSFTSPYPALARDVVNTLAEEFFNYSIETRYEATQQASEFLGEQIAQLRDDLASKERQLQKYGEEKKILFLNEKESTVVSKFADLSQAFTEAQIDRIRKEASYQELKGLKVNSLPPFVNNSLIQSLKAEYTRMRNEYKEKIKVFKPDYPEMVNRRAKLESMKEELAEEIKKAVKTAESDYRSALNKEKSLKELLNSQKKNVIEMNSDAIFYNSLQIEVENKRRLLNSLVAKQNETLVSARLGGLKTSNIRIVDKALLPKSPVSPDKKGNLLLGLVLGIISGLGLLFLIDYLDNTIKGPEDVEKLTGLPSLGIIPHVDPSGKNGKRKYGYYYYRSRSYYSSKGSYKSKQSLPEIKEVELVNHYYPKFSIAEDYRTIRTSILLSDTDSPPRIISLTSALPQEGKTATVANIAVSFAQLQKKVLIIDADLRKPRLHKIFNIKKNNSGLSGYLAGKISLKDIILKTPIHNLFLLPSGPFPPYPGELLGSRKMRELVLYLRKYFDFIFIDSPPVLSVTDSVIISSISEGTIMVAQPEKTSSKDFAQAVEDIQKAKTHLLGVVFNDAKLRRKGYYSSYYRRYYHYSYGEDDKSESDSQKSESRTQGS